MGCVPKKVVNNENKSSDKAASEGTVGKRSQYSPSVCCFDEPVARVVDSLCSATADQPSHFDRPHLADHHLSSVSTKAKRCHWDV